MTESKTQLAEKLLSHWKAHENTTHSPKRCLIGFDGFIDEIMAVVDQRSDRNSFSAIPSITDFSARIGKAANKSANLELIPLRIKIGGNAPIMCKAMLPAAHDITLCAALGDGEQVDPLFAPLASLCSKAISLGAPGQSQALEFQDGKIILGRLQSITALDYNLIDSKLSPGELHALLANVDLFASVNWTMIVGMNDIWQHILSDICPQLPQRDPKPYLFVDLADPAKRGNNDLTRALDLLKDFSSYFRVILGLNCSEAEHLGKITDCKINLETPVSMGKSAKILLDKLELHQVLIHTTVFAAGASADDSRVVQGLYCADPILTTGAGDNFNAGFCNALLYGFDLESCLLTGVANAAYYVRFGQSPDIPELSHFLSDWQAKKLSP